jgi:stearoyl-CoA desaturase (delta-9 desaturase)
MVQNLIYIFLFYLLYFHIVMVFYSVWMHRGYAHKQFTFSKTFDHVGRFVFYTLGWTSFPNWLKVAVGTHRNHHKYSDTENDSHSPYHVPVLGIYFEKYNPFYAKVTNDDLQKLAPDITSFDDYLQNTIYNKFRYGGLVVMLCIYFLLFGWLGLTIGLILQLFTSFILVPWVASWLIHKYGFYYNLKRKYPDQSVNVIPIGIYLCGEELHSNHHVDPNSYNFRQKWYEFDVGYWYALLFAKFKLLKFRNTIE